MNRSEIHHASGQSLVIIALLMIGILGFLGLIIDGGEAYVAKRRAQDAADSAAFAGVRKLAIRPDNSSTTEQDILQAIRIYAQVNRTATITDVVASYIDKNGNNICKLPCGYVPSSPLATGLRVTTTLKYDPYFINILIGNNQIPIPAIAAAQSGVPNVGALLSPTTLPFPCTYDPNNPTSCSLTYGQVYTLTGNSELPGGFQWVVWAGTSSTGNLTDYLTLFKASPYVMADPSDTFVPYNALTDPTPSPWIPSNTGLAIDTKVQCALDAWLNLNNWGSCNYTGVTLNWGSKPLDNKWIVPVFDQKYSSGNNAKYHVVMFAEFQLTGYWAANGAKQCNWVGAPASPKCTASHLPTYPNSGWELQACNASNQACIMGRFLKEVTDLKTVPGKCNTNGIDICAYGLSQ